MFGKPVFSSSRRVTCSDSGDRLFVTDWTNGVVVLDENGNYIETVKEPQIFGADGICADRRGNVFLCGYDSNNVIQMSQEGIYVGLVLGKLDGIERPQAVCFNELNNTLFVALQGSDEVRVFELE
jgi:sugar lactone lactonase YvrE